MRFLHTSDWHLGRLFHNIHLTSDQEYTLHALADAAKKENVDAVVIAGDIYDRAVPPTEAVTLLDDILAKLSLEMQIPVIMIAGNHDSPVRIGYMSGVINRLNIHVVGQVGVEPVGVSLTDDQGSITTFWPLAYTDPETARCELSNPDIHSHEQAILAQIDLINKKKNSTHKHVIIGHAFVAGSEESDSERALSVGGSGQVSASVFDGFDYVALGHLHRPQQVSPTVRYSGSLLKYSFAEAGHAKSVSIVELLDESDPIIKTIELPVTRDLVSLTGTFEELTSNPNHLQHKDAYVEIRLLDAASVLDPMARLRAYYPNILNLRREGGFEGEFVGISVEKRSRTVHELFNDFFVDATGKSLTDDQQQTLAGVIDEADRKLREVAS